MEEDVSCGTSAFRLTTSIRADLSQPDSVEMMPGGSGLEHPEPAAEVTARPSCDPWNGLRATRWSLPYLDFLAAGVLAQSVLFIAIFIAYRQSGSATWGLSTNLRSADAPVRARIGQGALGRRGLAQAVIVYLLVAVLGVDLKWNSAALGGVALVVVLSAALFSTFSLIIACLVQDARAIRRHWTDPDDAAVFLPAMPFTRSE
jgi:hypothetical protein